jgi:hypothetical protein
VYEIGMLVRELMANQFRLYIQGERTGPSQESDLNPYSMHPQSLM